MNTAPSLDAFRRLWATVAARPSELAGAVAAVSTWPAALRVPPPYAINRLVDGRLPTSMLALVGGLRLFDLVIDEHTHAPCADSKAQVRRLTAWLRTVVDEAGGVEIVDASPEGWVATFGGRIARWPMTREAWPLLFQAFRGARVVNLSSSDASYDVTNHDDYVCFDSFPEGLQDELDIDDVLSAAALTPELRELYLQGYSMRPLRASAFPPLPALEVLDLSGRWHRRLAHDLAPKLPRLRTLILGGDSLVRHALEGGSADELGHDFGIDTTAALERLLLNDDDVEALRAALPTLRLLLLGGEVRHGRVARRDTEALTVRDTWGPPDRRWLPW